MVQPLFFARRTSALLTDEEHDECAALLVLDEWALEGAYLSDQVRQVVSRHPNCRYLYLLAPYADKQQLMETLRSTGALRRASTAVNSLLVNVLVVQPGRNGYGHTKAFRVTWGESIGVETGDLESIHPSLVDGWLFNLFDSNAGMVEAPAGVHFAKTSKKHTERFLRASNTFKSSATCGLIAFFLLETAKWLQPRRVFVDTAPLISIVFAMQRVAMAYGEQWKAAPAQSFSSYDGSDGLSGLGSGDLVLISASTSGGLQEQLKKNNETASFATIFYVDPKTSSERRSDVVADLTFRTGQDYGYPAIESHEAKHCILCKKGQVVAPLEGDQFLLERRAVVPIRIIRTSQSDDASEFLELITRQNAVTICRDADSGAKSELNLDYRRLLETSDKSRENLKRLLSRYLPQPLSLIVLVGFHVDLLMKLAEELRIEDCIAKAEVLEHANLVGVSPSDTPRNVLVLVGTLSDHALVRSVNAQLRPIANGGCVSYLAAVVVADSPRNLSDLQVFLTYGERGKDTFEFRFAHALQLSWSIDRPSPWQCERELLLAEANKGNTLPSSLQKRLLRLELAPQPEDELFLPGISGSLGLQRDFAFLDTSDNLKNITQSDVYLVVSNLLAFERAKRKGVTEKVARDKPPEFLSSTIYRHVVLCPSNFKYYNDAVLMAAMLRAACPQELNFALDERASAEMRDILLADLAGWAMDRGNALPEFLLSMACGRLRLQYQDQHAVLEEIIGTNVAEELLWLARVAMDQLA